MLNLSGFTSPPTQFEGLNQMGNTIERNKQRDEYNELRKDQLKQQGMAKRDANMKSLMNYLNPKDYFTGTPQDPNIVKGLNDVIGEGMKLASDGADYSTIMMALQPAVGKLQDYSTKAKLIKAQEDDFVKSVGTIKGIDKLKAAEEFKNAAFYKTDASGNRVMKDISEIDPSQSYGDVALREGNVYNREGLDDYLKGLKADDYMTNDYIYNDKGGREHTKIRKMKPSLLVDEYDDRNTHTGKYVPAFDIAKDGDVNKTFGFTDKDGKVTEAPIRLLKEEQFTKLPNTYKMALRQEVRQLAKAQGKQLSSTEVENTVKAWAYDDIKNSDAFATKFERVYDDKPSPQEVRHSWTGSPYATRGGGSGSGGGSGANGEVTINDVYGEIDGRTTESGAENKYVSVNSLSSDAQDVILESSRKATGMSNIGIGDVYVYKNKDGGNGVYAAVDIKDQYDEVKFKKGTLLRTLSKVGVNKSKQVGAKEKREVVKQGNDTPAPKSKPEDLRKKYSY